MFTKDLIGFLRRSDEIDQEVLDLIESHLKERLYHFGDHFKISALKFQRARFLATALVGLCHHLIVNFFSRRSILGVKRGLSSVTYTYDELLMNDFGVSIERCSFAPKKFRTSMPGFRIAVLNFGLRYSLAFADFNYLTSQEFAVRVKRFEQELVDHIKQNDYQFLLVPGDLDFSNRLLIKVFKHLDKKSFCLAHGGMPFIYDHLNESRTDYVSMWGSRQTSGYIAEGYKSSRFFVTGHPIYNEKPSSLRFSLDNILVLSKAADGMPSEIDVSHHNRSESLRYIFQVERALRLLGVKRARLRVHPSENPKWYASFINRDFFEIDYGELSHRLNKSSLVIGPVSTVFIDSIFHGVNYLVFEPVIDGEALFGRKLSLPLDGSDDKVPVATSEDQLVLYLKERKKLCLSVIGEFSEAPCDLANIIDLIENPSSY